MDKNFIQELVDRLFRKRSTAFYGYFILVVLMFAGFGIFFAWYDAFHSEPHQNEKIAQNIATYFMAILATSIIDLNISWNLQNRLSFFIYSILFFVLGIGLLLLTYMVGGCWSFFWSGLGAIVSWVVWIIANADNEKLSDENFYNQMRGKSEGHGSNWK